MNYRLNPAENLAKGVRRIAQTTRKEINDVLASLQAQDGADFDKALHESRKCFKRLRGLLRLVRKQIGEWRKRVKYLLSNDNARLLRPISPWRMQRLSQRILFMENLPKSLKNDIKPIGREA